MYANDPTSVRQLRHAELLVAEQSRSARQPTSARPGWWQRLRARRRPTPVPAVPPVPTTPGDLRPTLADHPSHDLWVGLDQRTLERLSERFMILDVDAGDSLGRQGEAAPEFVVVLEGRIGVSIDGVPLAVLDAGSHFGSLPLLDDGPTPYRRASFDVLGPSRIGVAGRQQFAEILESFPVVAQRIRAITDVRRAYLRGRSEATATGRSVEEFPLHISDAP